MSAVIQWDKVNFEWEEGKPLFKDFSFSFEGGLTSLVGQNGTGKSTMMLLSAGRILPQQGSVYLLGQDTKNLQNETERNRLASFVYQNMEFETEEPLAALFEQVLVNGNIASGGDELQKELIETLELHSLLDRKLQHLSKGEMQRALLVFSLLYGSPLLFLDEPFFAMEEYQKEKALEYLKQYVKDSQIDIFLSLHQLEHSRKYCDRVILIHKNGKVDYGSAEETLAKERVEEAFQIPQSMLYQKEHTFRDKLKNPGEPGAGLTGNVKVYD